MLKHVARLFLNQKKKYGGLLVGQLLVFVVLLYCLLVVFEAVKQYSMPGMLNTDHVVCFSIYKRGEKGIIEGNDSDEDKFIGLCKRLETSPLVEAVTKTRFFIPYVNDVEYYFSDSVAIGSCKVDVVFKCADRRAMAVFQFDLEEGTWVAEDRDDGSMTTVITRQLADEVGWTETLGRKIHAFGCEFTVVGVIAGLKNNPLTSPRPTMIFPYSLRSNDRQCSVRVKEGEMINFRNYLYREFYKLFDKGKDGITMFDLEKEKRASLRPDYVKLISLLVPTGFLLVFAFMGTFGLFWLYSTKRRGEFALRLVVGSTARGLFRFVIGEGLLLTLVALVPGIVLFCWVCPFTAVNFGALGMAIGIMVLFSVFSAWWPAYQVSRVNPVEVMREE